MWCRWQREAMLSAHMMAALVVSAVSVSFVMAAANALVLV